MHLEQRAESIRSHRSQHVVDHPPRTVPLRWKRRRARRRRKRARRSQIRIEHPNSHCAHCFRLRQANRQGRNPYQHEAKSHEHQTRRSTAGRPTPHRPQSAEIPCQALKPRFSTSPKLVTAAVTKTCSPKIFPAKVAEQFHPIL